ncbi:O-antigen ligase family protein [Candidatus Gillettellia adelgis]
MLNKIKAANTKKLSFIIVAIAVSTSLVETTLNRNAFYLAMLVALSTLFIQRPRRIPHEIILISFGVFIVGFSHLLWHWRFPGVALSQLEVDKNYWITGWRLISGALLLFGMGASHDYWDPKTLHITTTLIIVGFFYTSFIGFYFYWQKPALRLEIQTVSTMTSYIYMLQSLLTIYVLSLFKLRYKALFIFCVLVITLWVILLTETRSSLLLYPVIVLLMFFDGHHSAIKIALIFFIAGLCINLITGHFFYKITARLAGTSIELNNYQKGDGNSSLGSRISMWKAGIHAIKHSFSGQSAATRFILITEYIKKNERGNPEALRNLAFHMHNDLIDAGSLQGITGIIAVLTFYFLVFRAIRTSTAAKPVLLLVLMPTIILGMVDTLFIDQRYVTNLTLLLTLYMCLQPSVCHTIHSDIKN